MQGVDVDLNSPPSLDVNPASSYRYFLEVYAPRVPSPAETQWVGTNSADGSPGNGTSWSDERNWSVDGVPDTAPRGDICTWF